MLSSMYLLPWVSVCACVCGGEYLDLLCPRVHPVQKPADGVKGQRFHILQVLSNDHFLSCAAIQTETLEGGETDGGYIHLYITKISIGVRVGTREMGLYTLASIGVRVLTCMVSREISAQYRQFLS